MARPACLENLWAIAVLGIVIFIAAVLVGFLPKLNFPGKGIWGFLLIVPRRRALVTLGWPALFKVLVAYGYAARIPVAIVMFFALHGHWGTHYDVLPPNTPGSTSFFGRVYADRFSAADGPLD